MNESFSIIVYSISSEDFPESLSQDVNGAKETSIGKMEYDADYKPIEIRRSA
jgi:hypothetical protein